ncbi:MAG: hypothetical protein JJU45_17820 [Acidimicrobiia bacterium]|nr:hypothetical protein [Acidimicrobiia bacterium]
MTWVNLIAGIGWDPEIRGILAVLVGFVVLCGAVYLLLATNTGARLGMLLSLAGLFGFCAILSLYLWVNPPGIGPKGPDPFWEVQEIHSTEGLEPPRNDLAQALPPEEARPTPDEILAAHPELEEEFLRPPNLSDIAGADRDVVPSPEQFGGWRIVSTADAGEAQAAADEVLVSDAVGEFSSVEDYIHLNTFATGGKDRRQDVCDPDDGWLAEHLCAAWLRIRQPFQLHPPNFTVVEVQAVIPQEPEPGAPPPTPVADESQPVYWVILERQLGGTRELAALYFVISFSLFVVFCVMLHYREKTLETNLAKAEEEASTVAAGAT